MLVFFFEVEISHNKNMSEQRMIEEIYLLILKIIKKSLYHSISSQESTQKNQESLTNKSEGSSSFINIK